MPTINRPIAALAIILVTLLAAGCDDNQWNAEMTAKHAAQQAEQSRKMLELQQEVAHDNATARQELIELERDVEAERARIGQQQDLLEAERQEIADERQTDSLLGDVFSTLGTLLACLLPIILCLMLLAPACAGGDAELVNEALLEDVVADEPVLFAPPFKQPALGYDAEPNSSESDPEVADGVSLP